MPVRNILRNYRNVTGIAASTDTAAMLAFESMLERDFMLLLKFSNSVSKFDVQPVTIDFERDQSSRSYTPDFHVEYISSRNTPPSLIEIKYSEDLVAYWDDLEHKFEAAERYCLDRGWEFQVRTEQEIRTPYLTNVKFLIRYQNIEESDFSQRDLLRAMANVRECSVEELLATQCSSEYGTAWTIPHLWKLVANREIQTDLMKPLSMKSELWISDQEKEYVL